MTTDERDQMHVIELTEDGRGGSRTTKRDVVLEPRTVVAESVPLLVSAPEPVAGATFVEIPEGVFDSEFHNAPREQYVIVLSGRMRTETTDGVVTEVAAGGVVLVRDVAGRGHRTTVLASPLRVLFLPVPA